MKYQTKTNTLFYPFTKIFKKAFLYISTISAWAFIIASFAWVIGAVSWFIIAYIWIKNLLIPKSIYFTALTFIILIVWAILIWIFMISWRKYHYSKYFKHNKRKIKTPKFEVEPLEWKIITLSSNYIDSILKGEKIKIENINQYDIKQKEYPINILAKSNLYDFKGNVIVPEGTLINTSLLKSIKEPALYIKLIHEISRDLLAKEETA